ncbi:MAG TPA: isoprenoid biosynthesis glyoxalase ElbB, partial [Geobacteraceae bacterium]|nr:isoprenoid biosynthesis glyoxalase ElbB [Geobacteraceae bacterium]
MKKKVGVVLSGCGVYDGSEIHEAVFTLLAIDRNGAEAVCMAPDMELSEVDHLSGKATGKKRNVLAESARIARGNIRNITEVQAGELDALVFPGGYGAAKNLCNFAEKGAGASIHPDVAKLLRDMAAAKKPICAICIAPALVAATLGKEYAPKLTIGNDAGTAAA